MAIYAAITPLIRSISYFLNNYDVVLPLLSLEAFKFAYKEFNSFRNFVERLDSRSRKRMSASLQRIADAILTCGIEQHDPLTDAGCDDFMRVTHSLVEQFQKVKEEYYTLLPEVEEEIASSSSSRVVSKSKMVGLRDKWRLLKDDLIAPRGQYTFNLLVGMAGIGKTALAREFFEDIDTLEWFDCRAWVTVGPKWESEKIMVDIIAQLAPEAYMMILAEFLTGEKKVEELINKTTGRSKKTRCEQLKEYLKSKRCLIVLDDVWVSGVHKYMEYLLPDNKNGSRVLVTSRMKGVCDMSTYNWFPFHMRLLNEEESWDLLREKAFAGDSCPPNLKEAGKKIAEKCVGLPLTIVTVADSLLNAEESLWIEVATKKKHQLFIDAYDQISKVLYPSYSMLNDNSKLLLLYMGAFLLKYEIPKSQLINLWIVEDFVELFQFKTLEYSAARMLAFLDYCSLVIVCQRDITGVSAEITGHIKSCRLHSSWWHFCQTEARKTNLFQVLDSYNEDDIEESLEGQSRLSIHNNVLFALKQVYNSIKEICAFNVQTLLCFGPYIQYMVPICFELRNLCRLDALNIRFYNFPLEVLKLFMLRCLALTCNECLPPSISDLKKLQYLIVHPHLSIKLHGAMSYMPVEIWDLEEMKHLEVMGYDLPYLGEKSLQKLATLSDVAISSWIVLNRVPNLTKLRITIELTPDVIDPLCCFDHISILTKLESLKCVIVNPEWKFEVSSPVAPFPCLSPSLTKLSLSGLGYRWEEMSKIALLPNLKVLKLQCNAFQGPNWNVKENGFPNLLAILIEDVDLVNLKCAHGSFKSLKVLRINHCFKLKEMCLGNIPRILSIEIVDCSPLVEWLVKKNLLRIRRGVDLYVRSSWRP